MKLRLSRVLQFALLSSAILGVPASAQMAMSDSLFCSTNPIACMNANSGMGPARPATTGVTPVIATGTGTLPAAGTYAPVGGITGFGTVGSSNFATAFGNAATAAPTAAPFAPGFSATGLVPPAFATSGSFAVSTSAAPLIAPPTVAGQTALTSAGSRAVIPTGVTPYQGPVTATPASSAPSAAGSPLTFVPGAAPVGNTTSVTSMSNADLARASMGGVAITGPAPGAANPALSNGVAQQSGMPHQLP